ncbi:unnamed protein product, partial [Protopolystoma xenopodis]
FGCLNLADGPAYPGGSFILPNQPYFKSGFGANQPHLNRNNNSPRYTKTPSFDSPFNTLNGYPLVNSFILPGNKSEGIGIFGSPPIPRDIGNNDHFISNSCFSRVHTGDLSWQVKDRKKTELELFGQPKIGLNFQLYENIPVKQSGPNWTAIEPLSFFTDIELNQTIKENITRAHYLKPTPVQKYALPIVLAKRDLMACAQTGSGKTAAFLIPILNMIFEDPKKEAKNLLINGVAYPLALVLAPTRELSSQIYDEARKFAYRSDIKSCVAYGGVSIANQLRNLAKGCTLLVATPGRLLDIIVRGKVCLEHLNFLVLDEADRMLDMGFEPQIRRIVEQFGMPSSNKRQTLMFSATFPAEIQSLARDFLHSYIFLTVGRVGSTNENISQDIVNVSEAEKQDLLINILKQREENTLILVFVETKRGADLLANMLLQRGFPAAAIHGDRAQADREQVLASFRAGVTPILIATAVAARGLDVPNVKAT